MTRALTVAQRRALVELAGLVAAGLSSLFLFPEIVALARGREASAAGSVALIRTGWVFGTGWLVLATARLLVEYLGPRVDLAEVAAVDRRPRSPIPSPGWARGLLLATPTVGFFLAALTVADRSWSYDEILTWRLDVLRPYPDGLRPHGVFANHLLAAALAKLVVAMRGADEVAVNIAFAIPVTLTILGLTWIVWRSSHSLLAATSAGAVLALHPLVWHTGPQLRGYGLVMLGSVGTALGILMAEDRPIASRGPALVTIGALIAGLAHLFGLLFGGVLLANWILRAISRSRDGVPSMLQWRRISLGLIWALSIGWLAWLPSLPWLFFTAGGGPGPREGGMQRIGSVLLEMLAGSVHAGSWAPIIAALALVALAAIGSRALGAFREWFWASVSLVAVSILGAIAVSPMYFFARFLLVALPGLVAGATIALATGGAWRVILGLALFAGQGESFRRSALAFPDLRGAVTRLERFESPSTRAWCLDSEGEEGIVIRHYAPKWIESCPVPARGADLENRAWLVLAQGAGERRLLDLGINSTHRRRVLGVGGPHSDLAAWVPKSQDLAAPGSANEPSDGEQ